MKEGGKVKKRTKMTLTAVVIMELIALLLAAAYAWIESVNKPEIRGQNLSISASFRTDDPHGRKYQLGSGEFKPVSG